MMKTYKSRWDFSGSKLAGAVVVASATLATPALAQDEKENDRLGDRSLFRPAQALA